MRYRIAILLVALMAWTGYVWAAHVDLPAYGDTETHLSDSAHQHVDDGEQVNDCDHCCHAAQHFSGLLPASGTEYESDLSSWVPPDNHALARHRHEPLFKPPKA